MKASPELDRSRFEAHLATLGLPSIRRERVTTLQVNIGLRCNLACHHCHVESGPKRGEALARRDVERILRLLERNPAVDTLDITGGAPELHADFRDLVRGARGLGRRVIDRCNLTVLFEPGQEDTASFLAEQGVPTALHYPQPVHTQQSLSPFLKRRLPTPITHRLCDTVISLPISAYMSMQDQDQVISAVLEWAEMGNAAAVAGR